LLQEKQNIVTDAYPVNPLHRLLTAKIYDKSRVQKQTAKYFTRVDHLEVAVHETNIIVMLNGL